MVSDGEHSSSTSDRTASARSSKSGTNATSVVSMSKSAMSVATSVRIPGLPIDAGLVLQGGNDANGEHPGLVGLDGVGRRHRSVQSDLVGRARVGSHADIGSWERIARLVEVVCGGTAPSVMKTTRICGIGGFPRGQFKRLLPVRVLDAAVVG